MIDPKELKALANKAAEYQQFEMPDDQLNWWCGGCGNYAIQNALKRALTLEGLGRQDMVLCFDIGCNGNGSDKMEGYTVHGLHGRVLPLAAGAALANPKLKVIASAGDGATLSEGVNHLIHTVRNDYPLMFLMHDNQNYALTTGQASATTPCGRAANASPKGVETESLNSLQLVLSGKPSFVARTVSADPNHMTQVFRAALGHGGFAYVEVLQSCPTYNKAMTNKWLLEHVQEVEQMKDYDAQDIWAARRLAEETDKIYTGILYQNPERQNFLQGLSARKGVGTTPIEEVGSQDISAQLKEL